MKKPPRRNQGRPWPLRFTLNGQKVSANVQPTQTLLDFCGGDGIDRHQGRVSRRRMRSCYVLVDGKPMNSCLMLAPQAQGRKVTTIEGFAHNQKLDVIQRKLSNAARCNAGIARRA